MNTIAKNQRKVGTLLTYLIAGGGLLSSVPALAATGAIYDAHVEELKITAIKAVECTNNLKQTPVHFDATGKVLDTSAGTVSVTCTGATKVALAIADSTSGTYAEKANGTPVSPAAGTLTITVGGGTTTSLASSDNHSSVQKITQMVVAGATAGVATFTLNSVGNVTAAGDFKYSLASAAWVE